METGYDHRVEKNHKLQTGGYLYELRKEERINDGDEMSKKQVAITFRCHFFNQQ